MNHAEPHERVRPFALLERWVKHVISSFLRLFGASSSPTPLNLSNVNRILVVRQHDQLGDMLCVVPLLRALKERFTSSQIVLVASPVNAEVMHNHPLLSEVITYDKRRIRRSYQELRNFFRALRREPFDMAIVPTTVSISLTSDLIAHLSRAKLKVGPLSLSGKRNPTGFLYDVPVALDWSGAADRHQTLRNLDILRPLRISTGDLRLEIGITPHEQAYAEGILVPWKQKYKVVIGFHPGAGKRENRWPADRFAEVANALCRANGGAAVITAGPMDDEPMEEMLHRIDCPHLCVRNTSIRRVAAIVSKLDLFVTNDTGLMHVAAAAGTPTLSLFGPTDPRQWAPVGEHHKHIKAPYEDISEIAVGEVLRIANSMLSLIAGLIIL